MSIDYNTTFSKVNLTSPRSKRNVIKFVKKITISNKESSHLDALIPAFKTALNHNKPVIV